MNRQLHFIVIVALHEFPISAIYCFSVHACQLSCVSTPWISAELRLLLSESLSVMFLQQCWLQLQQTQYFKEKRVLTRVLHQTCVNMGKYEDNIICFWTILVCVLIQMCCLVCGVLVDVLTSVSVSMVSGLCSTAEETWSKSRALSAARASPTPTNPTVNAPGVSPWVTDPGAVLNADSFLSPS